MTRRHLSCLLVALSVASACGSEAGGDTSILLVQPHEISAQFRNSRLIAPDIVTAGWTTLSMSGTTSDGHNLVAFRLDDGVSVASFLAALDTAKTTPAGALALGGPEEPDPAVMVHLAPGEVVLACTMRDGQGRRHAAHGEAQVLQVAHPVTPDDTGTAPASTITVSMTDFAYPGADTWPAGAHTITVSNDGAADHLLILTRLKPGKTLRDYVAADGGDVGQYLGGIARMGPGRAATIRIDLKPGDYVLTCLVVDPRTGQQHVELGMLKLVHVVPKS